jgi:hypothetical protein
LRNLKKAQLDLNHNEQLSDVSAVGEGLAMLTSLTDLWLDFGILSRQSDLSAFKSIGNLVGLRELWLDVSCCSGLWDVSTLQNFENFRELEKLTLDLHECPIQDAMSLGPALSQMERLVRLKLDFGNSGLQDLSMLGALGNLKKLTELTIDVTRCPVAEVSAFGAALSSLEQLTILNLNFSECTLLADLTPFTASMRKLCGLAFLELDFGCSGVTDVTDMGSVLEALERLRHFVFNLRSCSSLPEKFQIEFDTKEVFLRVCPAKAVPKAKPGAAPKAAAKAGGRCSSYGRRAQPRAKSCLSGPANKS